MLNSFIAMNPEGPKSTRASEGPSGKRAVYLRKIGDPSCPHLGSKYCNKITISYFVIQAQLPWSLLSTAPCI